MFEYICGRTTHGCKPHSLRWQRHLPKILLRPARPILRHVESWSRATVLAPADLALLPLGSIVCFAHTLYHKRLCAQENLYGLGRSSPMTEDRTRVTQASRNDSNETSTSFKSETRGCVVGRGCGGVPVSPKIQLALRGERVSWNVDDVVAVEVGLSIHPMKRRNSWPASLRL